jgi:hypothetical protein
VTTLPEMTDVALGGWVVVSRACCANAAIVIDVIDVIAATNTRAALDDDRVLI